MQRDFDRKMGWNTYESCQTPEDMLNFMQHFVLVMVEELGEVARIRKEFFRDKQKFDLQALRHELVDLFVYLMQGCMALDMNLEEEYKKKMKTFEERFLKKPNPKQFSSHGIGTQRNSSSEPKQTKTPSNTYLHSDQSIWIQLGRDGDAERQRRLEGRLPLY